MKILYSSAFVCCLLVWFSSPVQVIQAASHNAANTAAIGPSAAEAAVLRAASNAVQAARSIRLTNQVLQAAAAPPAGTRATTTASGSPTAAGVAIRTVSTNALQMVTTVRLQNQLSPAARMTALAAGQSNNRLLSLENGPACVRLGSGLVSWWQAEDDASDSVGSNSGVLANDASFDAGMVGEAFTFNGTNQSVEIPYSATMATPGFTLEAWVKPAGQAEDWLGQAFVFGQSYGRQLVVRAGSQGLAVALQISNDPWTFYEVDSSGEIPIGEWTHLAGTWDGGTLSLYINGTLDQQAAVDTVAWDSGCAFHIGGVYDPEGDCAYVGQFFNGLIDEVSLYDRALFAGEINAIYLAGAAGKCKTAPVCVACPASAVAWWPGQGDASDVFGNSPGVLQNGAGFGVGMTGQAFSFDGINQAVEVSYSSALTSSVFSLEAWVKPAAQIGGQAFVFGQSYGRQLVVRAGSQGLGVAFQISNNRWTFYEVDSSGEIPIGEWTHLVGTWDGAALSLYINGALDQQAPLEAVAWDSGCAFHIGGVYDPEGDCAYEGQFFNGLIDEVTYYSQALSAADVQALYNAGSAGKCAVPPTLGSQPGSQSVTAGNDAILQVSATGSSLSYQWYLNGKAIWGETQSTLYLANLQSGNAGTYTVQVFNNSGSVTSDGAVLTVVPAAPVPVPAGVVAWWRGEDDFVLSTNTAEDIIGNNPGRAECYLAETDGKVGRAFYFNGGGADLLIPAKDPAEGGLNSSSWTGFTVEGWIKASDVSTAQPIMEQWNSDSGYRITLSVAACATGSLEVTYADSGGTHLLSSLPGVVRAGTFQHIALAYNNQAGARFLELYLNGVLVAANNAQLGMALGATNLYFGSRASADPETYFGVGADGGLMDELTIYNRALTTLEITNIYNAGSAGKIPPCRQVPTNCVSWWEGESDGSDVYALNPAIVDGGVSFTAGQKGQAFTFSGAASVRVPASASLDVGTGDGGFTLEAWVKPDAVAAAQPIFEWNLGFLTGVAIWISEGGFLTANIRDTTLGDTLIQGGIPMTVGAFQHVALTYDKTNASAYLFLNGVMCGQQGCVNVVPLTTGDLYFGFSPADDEGQWMSQLSTGTHFGGQIDEAALYNQAVSALEIRRLYLAGASGKCGIAPSIVSGPESQTANAGNNVALQVVAAGTSLSYQWYFNNGGGEQAITGATGPALARMNVQAGQAGTYSVEVANSLGSVRSSGAVLNVNAVGTGSGPTISSQPSSGASVCEGVGFGLSVTASGSGTLRYQWCRNGINIAGATGSSYSRAEASCADSGTYTVVVYASNGQTTSANATVAVDVRPKGLVAGSASISPGAGTAIVALLTGTGPWHLTWSDGYSESGVGENFHLRWVSPSSSTTYTLTALSDANGCEAGEGDLSGAAVITVSGASMSRPLRTGVNELTQTDYTNFTFGGDMTYYVSQAVTLHGKTTIEGGTVVKFAQVSAAKITIVDDDVVCDTGPYRPAMFIAQDDRDYGYYGVEQAYEPLGYYGQGLSLAFQAAPAVTLKNLRCFNLGCGISFDGDGTWNLYDCQFIDCSNALAQTASSASVNVFNVLFCADPAGEGTSSVLALSTNAVPNMNCQHITVDGFQSFVSGLSTSGTWSGTNSLFVNVQDPLTIPPSIRSSPTCRTNSATSGIFQTGGDGSHYLCNTNYRGQGTTNIAPALLAELPQKSTHPPLDLPVDFETSGSITFSPQVPRYVPGDLPDLGYYYDALDYTIANLIADDGASITVLPGTAIGLRFDFWMGFQLCWGSSFVSQGMATRPNTFVPVSLVQEGPFPLYFLPGLVSFIVPDYWPAVLSDVESPNPNGDPPPMVRLRFSNFYLNSGHSHHLWGGMAEPLFGYPRMASITSVMDLQMQDCALHSGWLNLGEPYGGPLILPVGLGGPTLPGSVSLVNNLFDRVNINLDPDTGPGYWGGRPESPTIDLRLVATNNLFRGGWLFLEPVKASAGNWVFENNLFDKTVLAQDQYQRLDFDYNAYWPCDGAELSAGQVAHLLPTTTGDGYIDGTYDGSHEIALTEEPPYQTGPLGNYYLTNTTPLYHAGSCAPAGAGLYHYTTDIGQAKESDGHNVNIGLHYVATAGPGNPLPKDTDGDGIPDYVENWHGDGNYNLHTDTETDWTNAYTVTGVYDPTNAVYDDIDLSGNGLAGRIKKALGMDALDPSNPLALKQIITGQEPDIATFRVPIQHNLLTSVGELFLNVDGVDATLQECDPATNGSGECVLVWNTTYETPGLHCLQPALSLGGAVPDAAETEGLGFAALFLSANVVQFDESYSQFDDGGAVLYASLAQADATYTIYLRDPSMSPSDPPIRTIANRSTSSGVIQESWNPADDGYSGSAVDAVFEVNLLDDPASGSNTQRLNKRSDGLIDGTFDVAYFSDQPEQAQEDGARWECYMGVVDTLMAPDFGYIYEYHSTFNDYTGDGNPSNPGFISDRARVTSELLPNLGDSQTRNFYCSGHGLPAMIFEGTLCSAYITRAEVAQTLGNSWRPDGIKMGHPYRFIFLDACNTAKRKGWQHTFGVCDHISQGGDQAFVGWEGAAAGPATDTECLEYADTLWVLFDNWMSQVPLKTCLDLASDRNTRPYGDSRTLTFPLPVPKNADIFVQNPRYYSKFTSNLRIAGNQWITRGTAP